MHMYMHYVSVVFSYNKSTLRNMYACKVNLFHIIYRDNIVNSVKSSVCAKTVRVKYMYNAHIMCVTCTTFMHIERNIYFENLNVFYAKHSKLQIESPILEC